MTTVVVGGGPTGTEFAGELMHFINSDLAKIDPERARDCRYRCFMPFTTVMSNTGQTLHQRLMHGNNRHTVKLARCS